uniref:Calpain catalytic domain-containing protein n=1 Tax=Chromera velia CCMP2878 TaxID=1169474 RepID=A0A0G4HLT5_9ALVE|eukprot:Cvel_7395.t1-p1 / transcript=Cvel_7395.t1 / gene=Cvel_7395 / organism=Chromera_velia_CCMP2878 / gene_product=Calpain-11, putative / transcript_product=Calpain-11, putative / location=Cvel_scaffold385:58668-63791(-) / protein_length=972 / sequence_SO=supercontig / SO=protein_coding / is_pseudo=false
MRDVTKWTAEIVPDLEEELEIDLSALETFLKKGGKMQAFNAQSATHEERISYYRWMENSLSSMTDQDRRSLEHCIIRMTVMEEQDKNPEFQIPDCLKDVFGMSAGIPPHVQKLLNVAEKCDKENPKAAVSVLQSLIPQLKESNPQHAGVLSAIYLMLGTTLSEEQGEPEEAVQAFNKGIQIKYNLKETNSPSLIYHYLERGAALRKARMFARANADHEQAINLANALLKKEIALGILLEENGKHDEAVKHMKKLQKRAERIHGAGHPETQKIKKRLEQLGGPIPPIDQWPRYLAFWYTSQQHLRVCTEKTSELSEEFPVYAPISSSPHKLFIKRLNGVWKLCLPNGAFYKQAKGSTPWTAAWDDQSEVYEPNAEKPDRSSLWVDPDFPHSKESLGAGDNGVWVPVMELMDDAPLFDQIDPCDMLQGSIGDCWLITAISSAAEYPQQIRKLFGISEIPDDGKVPIRLWNRERKKWVSVTIDSFIPCWGSKTDQWWRKSGAGARPMYVKPKRSECWMMLLEKAFAKMAGGYATLDGGIPSFAWQAVSGEPVLESFIRYPPKSNDWVLIDYVWEDVKLSEQWHSTSKWRTPKVKFNGKEFFEKIKEMDRLHYLMAASTGTATTEREQLLDNGLITTHAYSIIQTYSGHNHLLLCLRNPHGRTEWKGAWGDSSRKWEEHPQIARALGFEKKVNGAFWMSFEDFHANFNTMYVCECSMPGLKASDTSSGRGGPTRTLIPLHAMQSQDDPGVVADCEEFGPIKWEVPVESVGCLEGLRLHERDGEAGGLVVRTLLFSLSDGGVPFDLKPHRAEIVGILLKQDIASAKEAGARAELLGDIADAVFATRSGNFVMSTSAYGKTPERTKKDKSEGKADALLDFRLDVMLTYSAPRLYGADEEGEPCLPEVEVNDEEVFEVVDDIEGDDEMDGAEVADLGRQGGVTDAEKAENKLSLSVSAPPKMGANVQGAAPATCCCTLQ